MELCPWPYNVTRKQNKFGFQITQIVKYFAYQRNPNTHPKAKTRGLLAWKLCIDTPVLILRVEREVKKKSSLNWLEHSNCFPGHIHRGFHLYQVNLGWNNTLFPVWFFCNEPVLNTGKNIVKGRPANSREQGKWLIWALASWISDLESVLINAKHRGVGRALKYFANCPSGGNSGLELAIAEAQRESAQRNTHPGCRTWLVRKAAPQKQFEPRKLLELSSKHLWSASWTVVSHYRKGDETAAHVVSSAVNLSSALHCLHMATRSLSPGSLSYTAGTDIYMTAVSIGSSSVSLFVSLKPQSPPPPPPPLPQRHKSNSSPLFKMSSMLIIELQCRCSKWK